MHKRLAIFLLTVPTTLAHADTLTLPNTLSNDTTADAQQVQENFQALADEANEDDARITEIEGNLRLDGSFNTAVGTRTLTDITSGVTNTAVGAVALEKTSSGGFNTAIGYLALSQNELGSLNTAVGHNALSQNQLGSLNTAIGNGAGPGIDPGANDLTNTTAIGAGATINASNTVQLGNANVVAVITAGAITAGGINVGSGSVTAGSVSTDTLDASGAVTADEYFETSDARLKESIEPITSGLSLINDLNPVSYHRIKNTGDDIEMGLLAQEIAEVLNRHGLSHSGMVRHASADGYMTVRYNDLMAPIIRAIQELDDAGDARDEQIVALTAERDHQVAALRQQLAEQQPEELLAMLKAQQERIARLELLVESQRVAAR